MKIAIIDIGSNNVRIVIYKVKNNTLYSLYNIKQSIRLINHLEDNKLTDKGYNKLNRTLTEYKKLILDQEVDTTYLFATAVIRYAENRDDIINRIEKSTGFEVDILSWQLEAKYGCEAVMKYLPKFKEGISIDLGGGSTEIVHYKDNKIINMESLKFGSVFLKSHFVKNDLPTKTEFKKISNFIKKDLEKLFWLKDLNVPILLIGGNARNLAKIDRDIINSDKSLNGYILTRKKAEILNQLLMQYKKEEIANIKDFTEERADIIIPSIIVFTTIAEFVNTKKLIISRYGLREGVLLNLLKSLT